MCSFTPKSSSTHRIKNSPTTKVHILINYQFNRKAIIQPTCKPQSVLNYLITIITIYNYSEHFPNFRGNVIE